MTIFKKFEFRRLKYTYTWIIFVIHNLEFFYLALILLVLHYYHVCIGDAWVNLHLEWSAHSRAIRLFCSSFCRALGIFSDKRGSFRISSSWNIYRTALFVIFEYISLLVVLIYLTTSYWLESFCFISFSYYIGHVYVINIFFILHFLGSFIATRLICVRWYIILSNIIPNALKMSSTHSFIKHADFARGLFYKHNVLSMWSTCSRYYLRHIRSICSFKNRLRYVLEAIHIRRIFSHLIV